MKSSAAQPSTLRKMVSMTMSAMLLLASFQLTTSAKKGKVNVFKRVMKTICRWKNGAPTCGFESTSKSEPKPNCGEHNDPADWTILVVRMIAEHPLMFATVIGKRVALTNHYSSWSAADPKEYKVFLMKSGAFMVKDNAEHCGLEDIKIKSKTDNTDAVLLVLDKDIEGHMVPPCLPSSKLMQSITSKAFKVPFYSKVDDNEFPFQGQSAFRVTMCYHTLEVHVVVEAEPKANDRLLKLAKNNPSAPEDLHFSSNPFAAAPSMREAVGGAVTQQVDKHRILFGILDYFGNVNTMRFSPYVSKMSKDILKWIDKRAGDNCLFKKL